MLEEIDTPFLNFGVQPLKFGRGKWVHITNHWPCDYLFMQTYVLLLFEKQCQARNSNNNIVTCYVGLGNIRLRSTRLVCPVTFLYWACILGPCGVGVRVVWYGMVVLCVDAWDTERIRDGNLTQAIRYHTGLPLCQNQSTYLNNLLHINEARYCGIYPILYHLRLAWCDTCAISYTDVIVLCAQYSDQRHLPHGLLTRNAKWRVGNAPGMPGMFS